MRTLKKFSNSETVRLETDDYAMMLHYFSTNNTPDWNKRRRQLNMMFSDSARIYEVHRQAMIGAELYNKSEFINKLLVPTATLGRMRIIDMQYKGEKIVSLRFTHEN